MLEIRKTEEFKARLDSLNDLMGRAKIQARIQRLAEGNAGNAKSIGGKIFEMRIDIGPGYRIYFTKLEKTIYLLLLGGSKRTQAKDIQIAKFLHQNLW